MIKPYIIIPNLIIQPTWGGKYIADFKSITNSAFLVQNIGQSYELYEFSRLSEKTTTYSNPTIELGNPSDPSDAIMHGDDESLSIQKLIDQNPVNVLGEKAIHVHGEKMGVLVKFTQAKGNSYQLHVNESEEGKWQSKPESWYYFEPGLVTLGVKKSADWHKYENICQKINNLAKKISKEIIEEDKDIELARRELKDLIEKLDPEQFVNLVKISKNQGLDLSACGMHHSWEESAEFPRGNIVYEVQKNVYDPVSTIRSFDKGNIKDDGSIRELQIRDYFKYVDRSDVANDPASYNIPAKIVEESADFSIKNVFNSTYYQMDELNITGEISNQYTNTTDSFHHLFVRQGEVNVVSSQNTLTLTKGYSAFIPASTGKYSLVSKEKTVILKTYL